MTEPRGLEIAEELFEFFEDDEYGDVASGCAIAIARVCTALGLEARACGCDPQAHALSSADRIMTMIRQSIEINFQGIRQ